MIFTKSRSNGDDEQIYTLINPDFRSSPDRIERLEREKTQYTVDTVALKHKILSSLLDNIHYFWIKYEVFFIKKYDLVVQKILTKFVL